MEVGRRETYGLLPAHARHCCISRQKRSTARRCFRSSAISALSQSAAILELHDGKPVSLTGCAWRDRYDRSYDVCLARRSLAGKTFISLNLMWAYREQASFAVRDCD